MLEQNRPLWREAPTNRLAYAHHFDRNIVSMTLFANLKVGPALTLARLNKVTTPKIQPLRHQCGHLVFAQLAPAQKVRIDSCAVKTQVQTIFPQARLDQVK